MSYAIEMETFISTDGKLPEEFHEAFGCKARVIVLLPEKNEETKPHKGDSERLMVYAGAIRWPIDDAVEWQRQQRSEWDRPWDC